MTGPPSSEPTWLDSRQQRVWREWLDATGALEVALGRQLAGDDRLTHAEFAVLASLSEQPDRSMRAAALAEHLHWETSRLSHQVTRMATRGLVDRRPCAEDRRSAVVALTDQGLAAVRRAAPGHAETVRRLVFDGVSPSDLEVLERVLGTVASRSHDYLGSRPQA